MAKRFYKDPDGNTYPLIEAYGPFDAKVYRTDKRKAVIGSSDNCIIVKGVCKMPGVLKAFIGAGKDAYVIFKTSPRGKPFAAHYVIPAHAGRVRDAFDQNKELKTQTVRLMPPTPGRTHEHRKALGKRRRAEIKAGAPVAKRGKPQQTRIMRIGVPPRPHAVIVKNVVTVPTEETTSA